MKRLALLCLLIPGSAWAQQPPPPQTPEMTACQGEILELTGGKFQMRTQVAALQAKVAELQKQIEAVKPPPPVAAPPAEAPK